MKNFFSGMRPPGGGKKASDVFKAGLNKKEGAHEMTPQEKYQKMLEDKLTAGRTQNAGNRAGFSIPGTAAPTQEKKELSKNMKMILDQLAATKAKKEAKRQKKVAKEDARAKKAAIRAEQVKQQQDALKTENVGKSALWGNNNTTNTSSGSTGGFWGGGSGDKKDDGGWW